MHDVHVDADVVVDLNLGGKSVYSAELNLGGKSVVD